MIDIEDELFRKVATAVRAEFSNVYITGDYAKAPPKFPFVSFVEVDNAPYRRSQTNVDMENHVSLLYEVDVYSNKATGKKSECKAIIKIIDITCLHPVDGRILLIGDGIEERSVKTERKHNVVDNLNDRLTF